MTGLTIARRAVLPLLAAFVLASGCSSLKYNALEKIGIHKRDLLVANVEDARDAQQDAQQEFSDALERFQSVVEMEDTDLKKAYNRLQREYDDSEAAAAEVSEQIAEVEDVSEALFDEWAEEIRQYSDDALRRDSEQRREATIVRYQEMVASMREAEASMAPVLAILRDNTLYLKHNLNAQAVGSLRGTFSTLESNIDALIERMSQSIDRSNAFIEAMRTG